MPRKRKEIPDGFNEKFPQRLRELIKEKGETQQGLADYIGRTRQLISYYCDGSSSPDWKTLGQIATYFNVTSDYLIGLSDAKQPENTDIVERLGLSEQAINALVFLRKPHGLTPQEQEALQDTINLIITSYLFSNFCNAAAKFIAKAQDKDNGVPLLFEQEKTTLQTFFKQNGLQILDDFEYLAFLYSRAQNAWQKVFDSSIGTIYDQAKTTLLNARPIDEKGIVEVVKKINEIVESYSGEPDGDD